MHPASCPICDSSNLLEATDDVNVGSVCADCGFEFSTFAQAMLEQERLVSRHVEHSGGFSKADILAVRESYGLTQDLFEKALGLGKKTVVRWERGTVPPSAAARELLWIAKNEREAFAALAAKNGVPAVKEIVAKEKETTFEKHFSFPDEVAVKMCVGPSVGPTRRFASPNSWASFDQAGATPSVFMTSTNQTATLVS